MGLLLIMYKFKKRQFFAVAMAVITFPFNTGFSLAQNIELKRSSQHLISLVFPSSSPEKTSQNPQSSVGAATRIGRIDRCVEETKSLTALMPKNQNNYAKTISAQPIFFIYVPQTIAESAEFIIVDQTGKEIDHQKITLKQKEGIRKITLSSEKELEIGQQYDWQFAIKCNSFIIISEIGKIERVNLNPEIKSQLDKTVDALSQARIYANEFIWQETLTSLISVRDSQPEEWRELLESVGLQDFTNQPLIDVTDKEN
jgi:hypothetical protein